MREHHTLEDTLQAFADVAAIHARAQFAAGDVALAAVQEHGRAVIPKLAEVARRTRRWVEIVLAVAAAVPAEMREEYADLPWTVFRFAASHVDIRPLEEWLQMAQSEGLSERQLAERLRGRATVRARFVCDECGAHVIVRTDPGTAIYCPVCPGYDRDAVVLGVAE